MRICLATAVLAITAAGAAAQIVQPNHLDCYFDEAAQSLVCPDVIPTGRAAAEPALPTAGGGDEALKGSAAWNAQCAAKYNSFDPATGMYRSYSGKDKPCRL